MKRILLFSVIAALVFGSLILDTGCANIVPPTGGLRDSLPPVLVRVSPGDSTRNFTGNRINFVFDEFLDNQLSLESIVMSPMPDKRPEFTVRLNTLSVRLKDALDSNTTYSINFGNAIKDFNEGNIYKNYTYTFSTGQYFDSLELRGKVILAETGKTDTTLSVILHTSPEDSAVVNADPRYIARLDGQGNFLFKNLPGRSFYIYALAPAGGIYRYQKPDQLFAFADGPVKMDGQTPPVTLYAYSIKPRTETASPAAVSTSIGNRLRGTMPTPDNRLRFQTSLINNQQDLLSRFYLAFDQPLKTFDSTRIRLYTDSLYTPAVASFRKDSTNRKIEMINEWKENTLYHLILDKDFAQDSAGRKLLKTDTLSFTTRKKSDYGTLQLRLRNLDLSKNPVLQIFNGNTLVRSVMLTGPDLSFPLFMPGEYELRILLDDNKNGVWDPGDFFGKHKQPELVMPVDRRITIKSNWQNEFEIDLKR